MSGARNASFPPQKLSVLQVTPEIVCVCVRAPGEACVGLFEVTSLTAQTFISKESTEEERGLEILCDRLRSVGGLPFFFFFSFSAGEVECDAVRKASTWPRPSLMNF